jgi:phosphoribosylformylglycinamidine synthase
MAARVIQREDKLYTVELIVTPRPGVRDPQAEAVSEALQVLSLPGETSTQVACVGRYLRLEVAAADAVAAQARVEQMCRKLLVNPNLETFQLRIEASAA